MWKKYVDGAQEWAESREKDRNSESAFCGVGERPEKVKQGLVGC